MAWLWLLAAGICEVVWAYGLKKYGFLKLTPGGIGTVIIMILSFILLAQAMKTLPLGTSYAVWTGIGAAGTAILGMVMMGEPVEWKRVLCVTLIVCGVMGLKLLAPPETPPVASSDITTSTP